MVVTTVLPCAQVKVSDWVTCGKVPSPEGGPVMMLTSGPP